MKIAVVIVFTVLTFLNINFCESFSIFYPENAQKTANEYKDTMISMVGGLEEPEVPADIPPFEPPVVDDPPVDVPPVDIPPVVPPVDNLEVVPQVDDLPVVPPVDDPPE